MQADGCPVAIKTLIVVLEFVDVLGKTLASDVTVCLALEESHFVRSLMFDLCVLVLVDYPASSCSR